MARARTGKARQGGSAKKRPAREGQVQPGARARRRVGTLPERAEMVLTELEQIKVLADPLRIRILEELCEERTTKQVAERLGEKPTKLYHHVDALERVGLIALTRTRPNRGTMEKYYQAAARSFRAASSAFSAGGAAPEEARAYRDVVRTILDSTSAELGRLIDQGVGEGLGGELEEKSLLTFLEIRADAKDITNFRRRLTNAVERLADVATSGAADAGADLPRYRLTLAFFPLDLGKGDR